MRVDSSGLTKITTHRLIDLINEPVNIRVFFVDAFDANSFAKEGFTIMLGRHICRLCKAKNGCIGFSNGFIVLVSLE